MSESEPANQAVAPRAPAMDMHVHTRYSDASITVPQLVELSLSRRLGICVCDHNEIRGAIELYERNEIVTLPGIEIGSAERLEFLCYFNDPGGLEEYFVREVEPYKVNRYYAKLSKSFTELIPAAKRYGAIVALPHPFAPGWKNFNFNRKRKEKLLEPSFLEYLDLIEVINSHIPDNRNFKAFLLSEILDKSVCAGSDAHRVSEVGSAYLSFGTMLTAAQIFDLLKKRIKVGSDQRFKFHRTVGTSRSVIMSHIKLYLSKRDQARWMLRYDEDIAYDPTTMPDRRCGFDRRRRERQEADRRRKNMPS
ncbi:MAG TPA: PHP-associated domain-containing protein [bacterium]|nr:PHP-associated domain-containing protein [bacterium]